MSKNTPSKQNPKMKSPSQHNKNITTIISSSVSNKPKHNLPTTSRIRSESKDEENISPSSLRTVANGSLSKQPLNRTTIQRIDAKPSVSRTREQRNSITLRQKPRQVLKKQTQQLNNEQVSIKPKVTAKAKPTIGKTNLVMNTVHNVTVSSPPSKRKETPIQTVIEKEKPRIRSKSRTLSPEEIVILKAKTSNSNIELDITSTMTVLPSKVKQAVAFEVVFDDIQKPVAEDKFKNYKSQVNSGEPEYDDDFESYESDFETGSSLEVMSESSNSLKSSSRDDRQSPPNNDNETDLEYNSDGEEESELTHIPITIIQREKEFERKLDSGNYDLNSKRCLTKESFDSFDTVTNSEQLDSGICYENNISVVPFDSESITYGGFKQFYVQPKITKRGSEIMSKIQFDTISFTLLDLKPFSYDTYMNFFGNSHTKQSSTQTMENFIESECQTDENELRSVWTQHPPEFGYVSGQGSFRISQCAGELFNDVGKDILEHDNVFENTIKDISKLRNNKSFSGIEGRYHKQTNFERINLFLNFSSYNISRILLGNAMKDLIFDYDLPNKSKGFIKLNTNLLNALKVVHVFANAKFNLILTVHESIENVYQTDFSNLIMVWKCDNFAKPLRLLSTWSEVSRAEICNDSSDIIVCGLRDGSVAMWDLRETYSFCSKLDGHLTHFAPTHSVAPSWPGADMQSYDSGPVVDVKSFRSTSATFSSGNKFKTVQFASLNETGLLAIWTLVESSANNYEVSSITDSKFEYSSPWARVILIQSGICDLREFIEINNIRPKSAFQYTQSNFEKDIFNDNILKELAESQSDKLLAVRGLRFINLDCGTELIFVATNRNFVISCSKTLKKERFRKIIIAASSFLFPTSIRLLPNENFLTVGLSNGSVMILNCNQDKSSKKHLAKTPDSKLWTDEFQSETNNFDFEIGKSCAIQNIIRNERQSLVNHFDEEDFRPNIADFVAKLGKGKKPYELRIFDKQILLSGSVLRKDLVQNLEFSNDGWVLFVLSDGNVRIYDFCMEKEVPFHANIVVNKNFIDFAVSRHLNNTNIVLLDNGNNVQIHSLK